MKNFILTLSATFLLLHGLSQASLIEVDVKWSTIQKMKQSGLYPYFSWSNDSCYLNILSHIGRERNGIPVQNKSTYYVTPNTFALTFISTTDAANGHGTESYNIQNVITNYSDFFKPGPFQPDQQVYDYNITSWANKNIAFNLKNVAGHVNYIEIEKALYFIIADSLKVKILTLSEDNVKREQVFESDLFRHEDFQVYSSYLFDDCTKSEIKGCMAASYQHEGKKRLSIFSTEFDLLNSSLKISEHIIPIADLTSDPLLGCHIYYSDQKEGRLNNIGFDIQTFIPYGGPSQTTNVKDSPFYLFRNDGTSMKQIYNSKAKPGVGHVSKFRDGLLVITKGYNEFQNGEKVDYSVAGESGTWYNIMVTFIDANDHLYYVPISITESSIKNQPGLTVLPDSGDGEFKAMIISTTCNNLQTLSARVGLITIR